MSRHKTQFPVLRLVPVKVKGRVYARKGFHNTTRASLGTLKQVDEWGVYVFLRWLLL